MGNSTTSLKSGYKAKDNSLISRENNSTFYDTINTEEEKINYIMIRNKIKAKLLEEEKINEVSNISNIKIPTMFEWSFKAKYVYLTGSFCNWNEFFLMKKDETGIFRLILDLKRGFHQYKFKVDNEWRYNINFPIINDNGFINNYIDTSDWEINGEYENMEINRSIFYTSDMDIINYMKEKEINLKLSEEFYKANIFYCNYIPLKSELFSTAQQYPYQSIIDCINKEINIDEDTQKGNNIICQKIITKDKNKEEIKDKNNINKKVINIEQIKNKNNVCKKDKSKKNYIMKSKDKIQMKFKFKDKYKINEKNKNNNKNKNKSKDKYKKIIKDKNEDNSMILYNIKFMHEQINHLHLKKIKNNNPLKISIISRFKLKFTTFVYYK